MDTDLLDVLVIGAGTAGLAAAGALQSAGQKVAVLEGRDRIGGRILTVHDPLSPLPIELGAEFVHGRSPELWNLLAHAHVPIVEVQGEQWEWSRAGLSIVDEQESMEPVFDAMVKAPEQSFASFLKTLDLPEAMKQAAAGFVEGFNAAHKEEVSIEWLNFENSKSAETEGERNFRPLRGYEGVPLHLAGDLDILLSQPVRHIRWICGEVAVETSSVTYRARRVVVTVPLGVLKTGSLTIDPEPRQLGAAKDAIGTGNVSRIVMRFRTVPWRQSRMSFLFSDEAFPVWWTPYPVVAPILTGWAAGSKADALLGLQKNDLREIGIESLRSIFGNSFPEPEAVHMHDWNADPCSRGAYSYVRTGGLKAQQALREPIEDTLYFAGEAADVSGHLGTVHGALASGLYAAARINGAR